MRPRFNSNNRTDGVRRPWGALILVGVFALASLGLAQTVKYTIAPTLVYPAGEKTGPQPSGLFVDSHTGEIYVADGASARIVIYDAQRRFNFEFSTRSRLTNLRQVAVDSQGRIFVLGDSREHVVAVFDFNGDFLNYLDPCVDGRRIEPQTFTVLPNDEVMFAEAAPARVHTFTTSGEFVRSVTALVGTDEATRMTPMLENLNVSGDNMIVTVPMIGQAIVCTLDGKMVRVLGVPGGGPTELSFPMAATRAPDGGFVILDKHRQLVQFLDAKGSFVREAGNFGTRPGCFFHPTTMAVCADGVILVGQMFANRVQSVVAENTEVATSSR